MFGLSKQPNLLHHVLIKIKLKIKQKGVPNNEKFCRKSKNVQKVFLSH